MITMRARSSFSDSILIHHYNVVAILGTFTHTIPEDEMICSAVRHANHYTTATCGVM